MIIWLTLMFPLAAAIFMLSFRRPGTAGHVALSAGALEVSFITICAWQLHKYGVLQQGHYLRADGLTLIFLINLTIIFAVVLVYSVGYLRHVPRGRFSSPRWYYALLF